MTSWWLAHWTEVLGFGTGLGCVLLAARRHLATFPLGIANNLVFVLLFTQNALYADAGLQVVYLVLGVQGWWLWHRHPAADDRVAVSSVPRRAVPVLAAAAVLGTAVLTAVLQRTDSTTELADAATTTVSLVAQVMMNRGWIQSWFVWIAVDVGLVGLFLTKGLLITAALYAVFVVVCVLGYRRWRRAPVATADSPGARPAVVAPR
jgi:nicotinamide mononucleotide transporter